MDSNDGSAKVCFGANPTLTMAIYYFQDSTSESSRVWIPLSTSLEDNDKLICAPALHTGVYMPTGKYLLDPVLAETGLEVGAGRNSGRNSAAASQESHHSDLGYLCCRWYLHDQTTI